MSEIICIPAAGQPDGSHRGPYILIRNTAAAPIIYQQNHTQTHKMLEGVHVQWQQSFLAVEVHASGKKHEYI